MQARVRLLLPYRYPVVTPDTADLPPRTFPSGVYQITVHPPYNVQIPHAQRLATLYYLDPAEAEALHLPAGAGAGPTFTASVLRIDFGREQIDQASEPSDGFILQTANSVLSHLRSVLNDPHLKPLENHTEWTIQYFDSEGNHQSARMHQALQAGMIAVGTDAWESYGQLPPGYVPPQWQTLSLDAYATLPDIGPALVLAFTALETLIASTLANLVTNTTISPDLWDWVFSRDQYWREPSSVEKFDLFLRLVTGVSLKTDNSPLWEAFQNLRHARNSFVHEGVPKVGGSAVTLARAGQLVQGAQAIIAWIEPHLPPSLRRPQVIPNHPDEQFHVEISFHEVPRPPAADESPESHSDPEPA